MFRGSACRTGIEESWIDGYPAGGSYSVRFVVHGGVEVVTEATAGRPKKTAGASLLSKLCGKLEDLQQLLSARAVIRIPGSFHDHQHHLDQCILTSPARDSTAAKEEALNHLKQQELVARSMALSQSRRAGATPGDVEFKAMEGSIEIIPTFRIKHGVEGLDVSHSGSITLSVLRCLLFWSSVWDNFGLYSGRRKLVTASE